MVDEIRSLGGDEMETALLCQNFYMIRRDGYCRFDHGESRGMMSGAMENWLAIEEIEVDEG